MHAAAAARAAALPLPSATSATTTLTHQQTHLWALPCLHSTQPFHPVHRSFFPLQQFCSRLNRPVEAAMLWLQLWWLHNQQPTVTPLWQ